MSLISCRFDWQAELLRDPERLVREAQSVAMEWNMRSFATIEAGEDNSLYRVGAKMAQTIRELTDYLIVIRACNTEQGR